MTIISWILYHRIAPDIGEDATEIRGVYLVAADEEMTQQLSNHFGAGITDFAYLSDLIEAGEQLDFDVNYEKRKDILEHRIAHTKKTIDGLKVVNKTSMSPENMFMIEVEISSEKRKLKRLESEYADYGMGD